MTEATTLLQALAGGPSRPHARCKLGRILDVVEQDDVQTHAALLRALAGDEWSSNRIAQLVTRHVEPVGRLTVTDHRTGQCACNR